MAVNLTEKTADQLLNIDGIQLFTARAGIKQTDRADLTLMVLSGGNTVGAVFTTNRFCAAPVHIAKSHLFDEDGVRAIIINTGNDMPCDSGSKNTTYILTFSTLTSKVHRKNRIT